MKTWTTKDEMDFDVAMGGYWGGWARVPPGRKRAYVDMLQRFQMPIVKAAMLNLVKSQEIDRVPQPGILFGETRAEEKRAADRARARGKADGAAFISKAERDLSLLCEHCVEIQDAKGAWWRFVEGGLSCEATRTHFPWTAAKPGQQERLIHKGLDLLGTTGGEPLMSAEEFSRCEDFWEPRVNSADPKKAAWWKRSRARLSQGRLPEVLEAIVETPLEHGEPTTFEVGDAENFDEVPF